MEIRVKRKNERKKNNENKLFLVISDIIMAISVKNNLR